jgi:hypothetical protein
MAKASHEAIIGMWRTMQPLPAITQLASTDEVWAEITVQKDRGEPSKDDGAYVLAYPVDRFVLVAHGNSPIRRLHRIA